MGGMPGFGNLTGRMVHLSPQSCHYFQCSRKCSEHNSPASSVQLQPSEAAKINCNREKHMGCHSIDTKSGLLSNWFNCDDVLSVYGNAQIGTVYLTLAP